MLDFNENFKTIARKSIRMYDSRLLAVLHVRYMIFVLVKLNGGQCDVFPLDLFGFGAKAAIDFSQLTYHRSDCIRHNTKIFGDIFNRLFTPLFDNLQGIVLVQFSSFCGYFFQVGFFGDFDFLGLVLTSPNYT